MKDDMQLEMIAGSNIQLEHIKDYLFEVSESNDDNIRHIKFLKDQNTRLQSELDKHIKDNRKLVKALKEYASIPQTAIFGAGNNLCMLAQEVLKEVGEEE